jgi:hypothetical protein
MQLALDSSTHDLIKTVDGGVERVSDGRYTVQALKCKLKTGLGEWLLNQNLGWLNIENDLVKNYDLFDLEVRAKEIILSTKYVKEITSMDLNYSKRVLTISFVAETIFGSIDLTIPWES